MWSKTNFIGTCQVLEGAKRDGHRHGAKCGCPSMVLEDIEEVDVAGDVCGRVHREATGRDIQEEVRVVEKGGRGDIKRHGGIKSLEATRTDASGVDRGLAHFHTSVIQMRHTASVTEASPVGVVDHDLHIDTDMHADIG